MAYPPGKIHNVYIVNWDCGGVGGGGGATGATGDAGATGATGATGAGSFPQLHAFPTRNMLQGESNKETTWCWGSWGVTEIWGESNPTTPTLAYERVGSGAAVGDQTSYIWWHLGDDWMADPINEFTLQTHIPHGATGWESNAIGVRHKFLFAPGQNPGTCIIRLTVYHPTTGAVLVANTRTVSASDDAYVWLYATELDLGGAFSSGQMLKIKIETGRTVGGESENICTIHVGEIDGNWT